jgi:adenine/guanine phosphoribosyltransferase-like PRPP-binding protein
VFDDVISTGGTVRAVKDLLGKTNATVVAYSCFATEGDPIEKFDNKPLFKITHLPVTITKSEA